MALCPTCRLEHGALAIRSRRADALVRNARKAQFGHFRMISSVGSCRSHATHIWKVPRLRKQYLLICCFSIHCLKVGQAICGIVYDESPLPAAPQCRRTVFTSNRCSTASCFARSFAPRSHVADASGWLLRIAISTHADLPMGQNRLRKGGILMHALRRLVGDWRQLIWDIADSKRESISPSVPITRAR